MNILLLSMPDAFQHVHRGKQHPQIDPLFKQLLLSENLGQTFARPWHHIQTSSVL